MFFDDDVPIGRMAANVSTSTSYGLRLLIVFIKCVLAKLATRNVQLA